jgi:hypothetical protein
MMSSQHPNYGLRRIRTRVSERTGNAEGSASLILNERTIAKVLLKNGEVEEYQYLRHMAQLPSNAFDEPAADRATRAALFIIELFDRGHENEWLKKRCRQGTVFRLNGDPQDEWRLLNTHFTKAVGMQLRADVGPQLEQIANEDLLA